MDLVIGSKNLVLGWTSWRWTDGFSHTISINSSSSCSWRAWSWLVAAFGVTQPVCSNLSRILQAVELATHRSADIIISNCFFFFAILCHTIRHHRSSWYAFVVHSWSDHHISSMETYCAHVIIDSRVQLWYNYASTVRVRTMFSLTHVAVWIWMWSACAAVPTMLISVLLVHVIVASYNNYLSGCLY